MLAAADGLLTYKLRGIPREIIARVPGPIGAIVRSGPLVMPYVWNAFIDEQSVKSFHTAVRVLAAIAYLVVTRGNIYPDGQLLRIVLILDKPDGIELIVPTRVVHETDGAVGTAKRRAVPANHFENFWMREREGQRPLSSKRESTDRAALAAREGAIVGIDIVDDVFPNIIAPGFAIGTGTMIEIQ